MANSEYNLTVVDGTALTISLSGPAGPAGAGGGGSTPAGSTLGQVQLRNSDGTALAADSGLIYTGTGNTGVLQTGRGQIAINALPYSGGTLASNIGIGFNPFIPTSNATISNNVQGNIGIGDNALDSLNSTYFYSTNNIAIGTGALASLTTCQASVFIGTYAGTNLTADSSFSTIVGDAAGVYYGAAYDSLTQASQCTFLGRLTKGSAAASTNQIVIGSGAIGDQNNSTVIGNTSTTQTRLAGNALKLGSATLNTSIEQAATGTSKTITLPNATGIVPVFDTLPIASGKVLTSSGVLGAATWQDPAGGTVDATIIDGSTNAVSGNAVFDELALKAPLASPTLTGEVVINTLVGLDKDSLTINNTSNGDSQETYGLKINKSGLYSIGLEVDVSPAVYNGIGVYTNVVGEESIGTVTNASGDGAEGAVINVNGNECKGLVISVNGSFAKGIVVIADGADAVGAAITATTGTDHATFGNTGIDRSFVARVKGAFGWIRGSFTGRIHPPDTLTADRTYTLPDDTGTIALINPSTGTQTFTGTQIFSSTTRPTSSATTATFAAAPASSLITKGDGDLRYGAFYSGVSIPQVSSTDTTPIKVASVVLPIGVYQIDSLVASVHGTVALCTIGLRSSNIIRITAYENYGNDGTAHLSNPIASDSFAASQKSAGSGVTFSRRVTGIVEIITAGTELSIEYSQATTNATASLTRKRAYITATKLS